MSRELIRALLCLFECDSRFEPCHDPAVARRTVPKPARRPERYEVVGPGTCEPEVRGHDADDRARIDVAAKVGDTKALTQDVRRAAEAALPQVVADQHDAVGVGA